MVFAICFFSGINPSFHPLKCLASLSFLTPLSRARGPTRPTIRPTRHYNRPPEQFPAGQQRVPSRRQRLETSTDSAREETAEVLEESASPIPTKLAYPHHSTDGPSCDPSRRTPSNTQSPSIHPSHFPRRSPRVTGQTASAVFAVPALPQSTHVLRPAAGTVGCWAPEIHSVPTQMSEPQKPEV